MYFTGSYLFLSHLIDDRARHYQGCVPIRDLRYIHTYIWTYVKHYSSVGTYYNIEILMSP